MAKNKITCVDLNTELKNGEMSVFESRKGVLTRMGDYLYSFVELGVKIKRQLWKCWVTIARCLYGKATTNSEHVQVQYYIPHSAYNKDVNRLADIIVEQAEVLAEQVVQAKVPELVDSLQAMKPMEDEE